MNYKLINGVQMNKLFIILHDHNGKEILIDSNIILYAKCNVNGDGIFKDTKTCLYISGGILGDNLYVQESILEIVRIIEEEQSK